MALKNNLMINFDGQTLFKVMQAGSFTVPDSVSAPSPSGSVSSGYAPTTAFDGRRAVAGGMIYAAFSDAAGTTSLDYQEHLNPGDVVAVSAAGAATTVSINSVVKFTFASTAVAGVLGFYS